MTFDAAVVGAGIVGAACARELLHQGMKVAVIDASIAAGGATAAGMGHIVVMDDSPALLALTRYSQKLWDEVSLPEDVEFRRCGTIWVAADEEEMAEVVRKKEFYPGSQVLGPDELARAEPNLRAGLAGGLLVPADSVVYPPCAAKFFLEKADVRQAAPAAKLNEHAVQLRDGSRLEARVVINATGCWAPELTPGLPVRKRKGHLVITDRYPGYVRHQLVELGYLKSARAAGGDSVAFNIQPRPNGQMLIGSSRQYDAESPEVEPAILRRMLERAYENIPGLARLAAIRVWTGFRASTPDKLPIIGRGSDGVFLATGHEGLGITTSLATARLIADEILGRASEIPREPYLPSRHA